MTLGEYFHQQLGVAIYSYNDGWDTTFCNGGDPMEEMDIESGCGQMCKEEIDRYKLFITSCNDKTDNVIHPLYASLRAQLNIYYYG